MEKIVTLIVLILLIPLCIFVLYSTMKPNQQSIESQRQSIESQRIIKRMHNVMSIMVGHLYQNKSSYPNYESYIDRLVTNTKKSVIIENLFANKFETSYIINKGETIALCLKSTVTNDYHDDNLIIYVLLHEMAHAACPEDNHTELFKKIFVFMLSVAIKLGIYVNINYRATPTEYCGIALTDNLI